MTIDAVTANRNWQLPNGGNNLGHDVARLIAALQAADVDVAAILSTLVQKAPLLNAALSGTPTAPTPGVADNSTKIATTAWARLYFADFIGAAPAALDTIAELAAALQNDPAVITNLTTLVGQKASKASNLADLADLTVARTNLSVYSKAENALRWALDVIGAAAKTTLAGADLFGISDSVGGLIKQVSWTNILAGVLAYFNATNKVTPIDADRVWIGDSTAANIPKYSTWTQVKAFLKTYFDTLYPWVGAAVAGDVIYAAGAGTWGRLAKSTDGLFLKLVGGFPSWGPGRTVATAVATTSGVAIDFTGIPSWASIIHVAYAGVSGSGTSMLLLRLGTASGVETTGYVGASVYAAGTGASSVGTNPTSGFALTGNAVASEANSGVVTLTLLDAATNQWACGISFANNSVAYSGGGGGHKTLAGALDRVRLTTLNGTDTFDAGKINISYS
ncbi:hypothetical protein EB230_17515 [Mesorhizobium sp. NZP2234]|uniref:hypothetical protein n=1 Tax=Mesorhizobium sp. NZP2234 TaxID=2483402 RepID=UPI001551AF0C|nr:hypothetical protein [Mesorhizobium sp. NZP2234]QKC90005.1 hypothetical protein EB230_17515 [Mesorhizobium sp. NZP2234]